MALRTPDNDPSLNPGQVHANELFNGLKKAEEKGTVGGKTGALGGSSDNSSNGVNNAENNPINNWKTNVSGNNTNSKASGAGGKFSFLKKKGPLGLIIGLLFGGGAMTLIGTASGPISWITNVAGDVNDQLASLEWRRDSMLKNKLSRERGETVNGCTVLSVRCKFKTMTSKQIKKLAKVGVEVIPELDAAGNPKKFFGRTVAKAYRYQNVEMDAATYVAKLKSESSLRLAVRKSQNMKYSGFSDSVFVKKVLNRFGISMTPPELTGTHQEKVDKLLNKAGTSDAGDLKFIPVDDEGSPLVDGSGNELSLGSDGALVDGDGIKLTTNTDGVFVDSKGFALPDVPTTQNNFTLKGASGSSYSLKDAISAKKSITVVSGAKTPLQRVQSTKVGAAALGVVSVLGYWDLACSIKNTIGAATVAAKVANSIEFAQYAMPIMSMVGSMKAGDLSEEDASIIGEFFMKTDSRKTIMGTDDTKGVDSAITEIANPNYGKNVMDSSLYQMSVSGEVAPRSAENTQFSLGLGISALLSGFANFAAILDVITNLGVPGNTTCNIVQNWAVRGLGVVVGIIGMVGTTGGSLAVQAGITVGMMIVLFAASAVLNNALTQSSFDSEMQNAPAERAAALWSGMAAIEGQTAMSRGMMPGNSEQIVAYAQLQNEVKQDYIAIESEGTNPLDASSQYSFLGMFINNISKKLGTYSGASPTIGGIFSLITGSMSSIVDEQITHASTLDTSRYETCDDISYQDMGIDADVQCNVRYILSAEDLALDTDVVALYMEDNGYVEQNTTTGLPEGYTEPSPSESQGVAMDLIMGQVNTYFNTRSYGTTAQGQEYGKYLDYCVYRTMPFGETFQESTAIGAPSVEWQTGANCMKKEAPYNYFRIYTFDKTINDMEDEGSNTTEAIPPISTLYDDSTSIECAAGTTEAGTGMGYDNGIAVNIHLCSLPNTQDLNDGSNPVKVNARVSSSFYNLVEQLKNAEGTEKIKVYDGYRTMAQQIIFWCKYSVPVGSPVTYLNGVPRPQSDEYGCNETTRGTGNQAAVPGTSNHQMGLAVDFNIDDNGVYNWLTNNASTYGISKLPTENWHWQISGL